MNQVLGTRAVSTRPGKIVDGLSFPPSNVETPAGNLSILQNAGEVILEPFPHIVIHDALPADLYKALAESRISGDDISQNRRHMNNMRVDVNTASLLRSSGLAPVWKDFITYHTSNAFWQEVVTKFGPAISNNYPTLDRFLGDLRTLPTGVRFRDNCAIHMECQIGVNTPVFGMSRVRGPHLDNPLELFAGLLYMRDEDDEDTTGGDFLIHSLIHQPSFYGKAEIEDYCVRLHSQVRYGSNVFVAFINTPVAVHSVRERAPTKRYRNLVNFAAELSVPLYDFNLAKQQWNRRSWGATA